MANREKRERTGRVGLRQQVLLAAVECSAGNPNAVFTAEELLLVAWKRDPAAWGLRGHELEHPDSEKIYKEIDRVSVGGRNVRGGLVGLGLLEQIRQRTYRMTPAGMAVASEGAGSDPSVRGTAERALADAVTMIISHPVFRSWLQDSTTPKHFRDAGYFWGIAPGTPPSVIRTRIIDVERTLSKALAVLNSKHVNEITGKAGKVLFERTELERALQFNNSIKDRFARDLSILQVDLSQ